jgi:ABC-type branched-subunit amino acid transport system substrate-binding protein
VRKRSALLVVALALLASACGSRGVGDDDDAAERTLDTFGAQYAAAAAEDGVTADTITIANLADLTGPVPGLFKAAQDGMKAFVAYTNSQGGVLGRQLELQTYDTNTNATEHRIATTQACNEAFAIVGSFSVGDNGGASVGEECGIPNIIDTATSPQAAEAEGTFAPVPVQPNLWPEGPIKWIKDEYPEAVEHAGIIAIDNPITILNGERLVKTAEHLDYTFDYVEKSPAVESNFAPYVVDMRNRGVQYLTWSGESQNLVRLMEALQQQNFRPDVVQFDAVAYNQGFLRQAGDAAEGILIPLNVALLEEADGNPEMQKYLEWLEKTVPGAQPDIFGIYSWSAGLLFVKALEQAGEADREAVLRALEDIHQWDGNGLHAPTDPGAGIPANCFVMVRVHDGRFERVYPDSGFDCDSDLYEVPDIGEGL